VVKISSLNKNTREYIIHGVTVIKFPVQEYDESKSAHGICEVLSAGPVPKLCRVQVLSRVGV
jgi:hypothetical protein